MLSLLVPLLNSVIWRVTLVLGIIFSTLAAEAVALQSRNGSDVPETVAVDVAVLNKHQGNVLSMPLRRIDHRGIATPSIGKRFFKTEVLGVFGAAYLAEITIGTSKNGKKQVIDVLIDTGSFELWVDPVCSTSNVPEFCEVFGHYDPALSSTSKKIDGGFGIKYGSGEASGDYYMDDIYISGAKVQGQQFGVANSSELVWFGIMGLAHGQGNGFIKYPLVIDSIASQGLSNTKLFSLDLGKQVNPGGAITGELVFGGVDTNKYAGLLQKIPTDPSDPHYRVTLNSLAHRAPGATVATPFIDSNLPVSVIVDSGTTLSLLPQPIVSKLAAQFPGAQPDGAGGYRVDCAYQRRDGSVDFSFLAGTGTVTINVAYNDFIWNSGGDCFLGVWSSNDLGVWILGDTFLRGAYVTFDQTNNALFMSNYISCGGGQSNLVTVPAGPDAAANIPGACSVAAAPPPSSTSSTISPTFPSGTPSDTAIPSAESTLGPSLNPVGPPTPPPSSYRIPSPTTSAPANSSPLNPSQHPSSETSHPSGPGDPKPNGVGLVADEDSKVPPATKGPTGTGLPTRTEVSIRTGASTRTGVLTRTVTTTVTRGVVYTVAACPDSVTNCPLRGQVSTRFETVVTTFCPENDEIPGVTANAGGVVFVTESSAPASTLVVGIGDTVYGSEEGEQQLEEGQQQQQQKQQEVMTTTYPTTTIYKISSCAAGDDDACTAGKTTTRVITLSKTVFVHPVSTPSSPGSIAPGAEFARPGSAITPVRRGTARKGPWWWWSPRRQRRTTGR
ncbi:hypothetical protein E0Z10_g10848 [Xylaria hypoxylon]|uniref:Peptidase A1 domain-containing protein n=1 Tax=Xylaria hypoxylon TaxID=37992 RepID=A0A4Z0YBL1_9PEZI|nr:hypothetical protein E0Z10_g10848 [Xylaria hypoxylon]